MFIALTKKNGKLHLVTAEHKIPYSPWSMGVYDDQEPVILEQRAFFGRKVTLKMDFSLHYQNEQVMFSYFDEIEKKFVQFGPSVKLRYTLDQFVGVRSSIFLYSTEQTGAEVKFSCFKITPGINTL